MIDWKARHKRECKELAEKPSAYEPMLNFSKNDTLLPEFALSEPMEEEEEEESESESDSDDDEEEEKEGKQGEDTKEKNNKL